MDALNENMFVIEYTLGIGTTNTGGMSTKMATSIPTVKIVFIKSSIPVLRLRSEVTLRIIVSDRRSSRVMPRGV